LGDWQCDLPRFLRLNYLAGSKGCFILVLDAPSLEAECSIPGGIQGQAGCGSGQFGLVVGDPAHSRGIETR